MWLCLNGKYEQAAYVCMKCNIHKIAFHHNLHQNAAHGKQYAFHFCNFSSQWKFSFVFCIVFYMSDVVIAGCNNNITINFFHFNNYIQIKME